MPDISQALGPLGGLAMFMFGSGVVAGWKVCQSVAVKSAHNRIEEQCDQIKALEGKVERLYDRLLDGAK